MEKFKKLSSKMKIVMSIIIINILNCVTVLANTTGEDKFDNIVVWIAGWIGKIGLLVAFYGAVQIGFSVPEHDAGQKRSGILFLVSGLMVYAISVGYKTLLGL